MISITTAEDNCGVGFHGTIYGSGSLAEITKPEMLKKQRSTQYCKA